MTNEQNPVCSIDDYAAADADSSTMSNSEQDSASSSCPAGEKTFEPCDVAYVTLAEVQGSKVKVYEVEGNAFVEKKPDGQSQRKISSTGEDGALSDTLMVTGDKKGAANPTKVQVLVNSGGIGFCDTAKHPLIEVASDSSMVDSEAGEEVELEVHRELYGYELTDSSALKSLLSPYWPLAVAPKVFDINVAVCGVRNEGSVHGAQRMRVEVYPSDQYTLKLKVPPFKKTKHEVSATRKASSTAGIRHAETTRTTSSESTTRGKKEGSSSSTTTSSKGLVETSTSSRTSTGSDGVVHTTSETEGQKAGDAYAAQTESLHFRDQNKILAATDTTEEALNVVLSPAPPAGVTFELTRSGKVDETTQKVQEILHALKNLEYTFKEVFNTIKRLPSIGWKATLDVSFFSGDLYLSWGFREAADWQVGYGFTMGAQIKVVDITAAISFGAELSVATAKLEGSINGAVSVTGELGALLKAGDGTTDLSGKLAPEGKITVTFKGVAEVGVASYKLFEAEAGIQTGFVITCEPKVTREEGIYLQYDIKFLPLTFYYQTKSATGYAKKEKYELTEQLQVARGRFPEAMKTDPADKARQTGLVAG